MNVFVCAIVRIFSFGERLTVNGAINLSPRKNVLPLHS